MRLPRDRSGYLAIGGSLVAASLLVVGFQQNAVGQPLAGTCTDRDARPVACADPAAVYQVLTSVAEKSESACPRGDYVAKPGADGTLCLGYNVAAGDCVQDDPEGPSLVACAPQTERPTFQVLKIVDDRANAKACKPLAGNATVALTYAVPAKTLCIAHLPIAAATD